MRVFDFAELRHSDAPLTSLRESRRSVLLKAIFRCAGRGAVSGRIRNISHGGLMAELAFSGQPGDAVEISLPAFGDVGGKVAWIGKGRIGVAFDHAIDPAAILSRPATRNPFGIPRPTVRAWRPAIHAG